MNRYIKIENYDQWINTLNILRELNIIEKDAFLNNENYVFNNFELPFVFEVSRWYNKTFNSCNSDNYKNVFIKNLDNIIFDNVNDLINDINEEKYQEEKELWVVWEMYIKKLWTKINNDLDKLIKDTCHLWNSRDYEFHYIKMSTYANDWKYITWHYIIRNILMSVFKTTKINLAIPFYSNQEFFEIFNFVKGFRWNTFDFLDKEKYIRWYFIIGTNTTWINDGNEYDTKWNDNYIFNHDVICISKDNLFKMNWDQINWLLQTYRYVYNEETNDDSQKLGDQTIYIEHWTKNIILDPSNIIYNNI